MAMHMPISSTWLKGSLSNVMQLKQRRPNGNSYLFLAKECRTIYS